jgi:hypothetical protein
MGIRGPQSIIEVRDDALNKCSTGLAQPGAMKME